MRTTFSILLCKFATLICHLFRKNGTVFPGSLVRKIQPHVLDNIKYPEFVIVVTGSSGKGSTVSMLAHLLEVAGKNVIWDPSGSNITRATTTLILNKTNTFSHKLKGDVLLLEMDEKCITGAFKKGIITHLCITNITRDQPGRNYHPMAVLDDILKDIDDDVHLILNADDPLLDRLRYLGKEKITTFGIAKTKYDIKKPSYAVDFAYCPSCQMKLKYDSYHYGHLGIFKCPRCSFSRGQVDYEATDVDLEKGTFKIVDDEIKLNKNVFFAVYYTLLAYTMSKIIGLDDKIILKGLNEEQLESKRLKAYSLNGRNIEMLESKNENALSYIQSINYIKNKDGKKTVVLGFENVSRRYQFNDLSWLWDIDFELLNDESIDKIFIIGRFKYDIKVRLEYADIDPDKLMLIEELDTLIDEIENKSQGDIYTMVCFDMTEIICNLLKEKKDGKEN